MFFVFHFLPLLLHHLCDIIYECCYYYRLGIPSEDSGEGNFFAALDYSTSAPEPSALPPPPKDWLEGLNVASHGLPLPIPIQSSISAPTTYSAHTDLGNSGLGQMAQNLKDILQISASK